MTAPPKKTLTLVLSDAEMEVLDSLSSERSRLKPPCCTRRYVFIRLWMTVSNVVKSCSLKTRAKKRRSLCSCNTYDLAFEPPHTTFRTRRLGGTH